MKNRKQQVTRRLPAVSTASLPDIVFILLFFFMTVTVFNDKNLLIENTLPNAAESEPTPSKDGVIEIYMGRPSEVYTGFLGEQPRIQISGKLVALEEMAQQVLAQVAQMPEQLRQRAMVSLYVDKGVGMGLVNDVKKELQRINLLKINYVVIDQAE